MSVLELFYQALTERVSSQTVLANIARDIEIAPKTAKSWLTILEKTYSLFIILPYAKNLPKAILKSPKIYFYDNAEVSGDSGAQFENLVASHLLKRVHYLTDLYGDKYDLRYLKDKQGHEIDFVILKNLKPICLIEVKLSDSTPSKSLFYYKEKMPQVHCIQLVKVLKKSFTKNEVHVAIAADWLSQPLENDIFS
jgi:predicted AAA+ superfamily ATPase